jgi:putative ABC transport system permease protein
MKKGIDPTRVPAAQLLDVLRQLGFNPDELPKSVMRKFNLVPTTGPAVSTQPWLEGAGAKSAASAPPAGAGGELLTESHKEEDHDAHDEKHAKEEHGEEHAEGEDGHDHEEDAYHLDEQGNIIPDLPKDEWEISAILVNTRGAFQAQSLMYRFRVAQPEATAVNPASVMREFFDTFLEDSTRVLLVLAALVSVVAAVSILVSIYNSVSARQKEIAVLRALGATRGKVLTLICLEAVLIGLLGGILGLVAGHLVAAGGSVYFEQTVGEGIDWVTVSPNELLYLGVVLMVALLAGLVPALKAYRVPVATNLVAG